VRTDPNRTKDLCSARTAPRRKLRVESAKFG
jgi:hypothetical protein